MLWKSTGGARAEFSHFLINVWGTKSPMPASVFRAGVQYARVHSFVHRAIFCQYRSWRNFGSFEARISAYFSFASRNPLTSLRMCYIGTNLVEAGGKEFSAARAYIIARSTARSAQTSFGGEPKASHFMCDWLCRTKPKAPPEKNTSAASVSV